MRLLPLPRPPPQTSSQTSRMPRPVVRITVVSDVACPWCGRAALAERGGRRGCVFFGKIFRSSWRTSTWYGFCLYQNTPKQS